MVNNQNHLSFNFNSLFLQQMAGRGKNQVTKNTKRKRVHDDDHSPPENEDIDTSTLKVPNAHPISSQAPIIASYNDQIRPLLDVVDRLRNLKIMAEGIQLPTIVVVGDQSSGKSSVLESLAGISLPRGQGICTRVPLIMRLQHHHSSKPELSLEYNNEKTVSIDEAHISDAINTATEEIAGKGKGISNTPLTLIVRKNGVPDLTMIDLPGITRVPVLGQPENIYEQIRDIIMEHITPEESIVLNVLSATVDFSTCESIRMSQMVDRTGERTLAVVTKSDKAAEGLYEKVTSDDVNIGLGYVCVRNRIGDESYEDARVKETNLFQDDPHLSKIEKSMVGVPVLAQRLVEIQANIIAKSLPEIVRKINEKLNANVAELKKMPQNLATLPEALTTFMQIMGFVKESLSKLLLRGEYDEYPNDTNMHCAARLAEKLNTYSCELHKCAAKDDPSQNFLMQEINILDECRGIGLPNFMPRSAFMILLKAKVQAISGMPVAFVERVWEYIQGAVDEVLIKHTDNYPQVIPSIRRAANNLIEKIKDQSLNWVMEIVEMEKLTDYTCDPDYKIEWNKLMAQQETFIKEVLNHESNLTHVTVKGFGKIEIVHLRNFPHAIEQAFDLKMRITAYWKTVLKRLVDSTALHIRLSIQRLVNTELEKEIVNEIMGPNGNGLKRMLEELPSVSGKRQKLNKSINLLRESKDVVAKVIDKVAAYGD